MIIGNINYAVICIVFLVAAAILAIVPPVLSFALHGEIKEPFSMSLRIFGAIFILMLAFSLTLDSLLSDKSLQNIDALNNHYGITISTNSSNTTTGLSKKSKELRVLPGNSSQAISFTDNSGNLINGTLVVNGNKATVYSGSGSSMTEYANE
jgi:hypothetical protein